MSEEVNPVAEPAAEELPTDPPTESVDAPTPADASRRQRVRWGLLGSLVLVIAIMILALQNPQVTQIQFLAWKTPEIPVSVVILASAVAAVLLDEFFGVVWRFRRKRRKKKQQGPS